MDEATRQAKDELQAAWDDFMAALQEARRAIDNPELMPCDSSMEPVQLSIATSLYGFKMADLVTVQITLDPEYQDVFAFPSDRHRAESRVTQADFQMIADAAREHDEEEYKALSKP